MPSMCLEMLHKKNYVVSWAYLLHTCINNIMLVETYLWIKFNNSYLEVLSAVESDGVLRILNELFHRFTVCLTLSMVAGHRRRISQWFCWIGEVTILHTSNYHTITHRPTWLLTRDLLFLSLCMCRGIRAFPLCVVLLHVDCLFILPGNTVAFSLLAHHVITWRTIRCV